MGHVMEDNSVTITFQDYLFSKYNITGKKWKFGNSRLRVVINHSISSPSYLGGGGGA